MTVREARIILSKVHLSDCIFLPHTTDWIWGLKEDCPVTYDKFVEAWKRIKRFNGQGWKKKYKMERLKD